MPLYEARLYTSEWLSYLREKRSRILLTTIFSNTNGFYSFLVSLSQTALSLLHNTSKLKQYQYWNSFWKNYSAIHKFHLINTCFKATVIYYKMFLVPQHSNLRNVNITKRKYNITTRLHCINKITVVCIGRTVQKV